MLTTGTFDVVACVVGGGVAVMAGALVVLGALVSLISVFASGAADVVGVSRDDLPSANASTTIRRTPNAPAAAIANFFFCDEGTGGGGAVCDSDTLDTPDRGSSRTRVTASTVCFATFFGAISSGTERIAFIDQ